VITAALAGRVRTTRRIIAPVRWLLFGEPRFIVVSAVPTTTSRMVAPSGVKKPAVCFVTSNLVLYRRHSGRSGSSPGALPKRQRISVRRHEPMNIDPPGVPVARHMVWRHVWRVCIQPTTTRRSRLSALPQHPFVAFRRRILWTPTIHWARPEAFSSPCSYACRSGLVSL
jgi:hypothetical protein